MKLTERQLCDALAASGVVDEDAVNAPYTYDDGVTLSKVINALEKINLIAQKPTVGWVEVVCELPPVGQEVLVCQEGVDANSRAKLLENGEWEFSTRLVWMVIEAKHIKNITHWWRASQ